MPALARNLPGPQLNIIVVEDHDELRQSTVESLSSQGYAVRGAATGVALEALLEQAPADLLILDINLPHEDGLQISRRMRDARPDIGIIIVTARARADDKVAGYASGADLYLVKPISPGEFYAAINAVARRLRLTTTVSEAITLSLRIRQLVGTLGKVDVSKREADLLVAFAKAPDNSLETPLRLSISCVTNDEAGKHTLEVQIVRLRKKLEQAGASSPTIKSIRSQGYQLCVPLIVQPFIHHPK